MAALEAVLTSLVPSSGKEALSAEDRIALELTTAVREDEDPVAALRLARRAAAGHDLVTAITLYHFIMDVTENGSDNLPCSDPVADLMRFNAQFHLAVAYYDGLVEPDSSSNMTKGLALMRDLVSREIGPVSSEYEQEMADVTAMDEVLCQADILKSAQYNLGRAFLHGVGAIKNESMALAWFQKGAANGCNQSMHELGRYYSGGSSIDPISDNSNKYVDKNLAQKWHLAAAESGNRESMVATGIILSTLPHPTEASKTQALNWLKCASTLGSIAAQAGLAFLYYKMHFYNKAVQWATRVTGENIGNSENEDDRGNLALACWVLGKCHEQGRGAISSREDAEKYMKLAAQLDVDTVKRLTKSFLG